MNASEDKWQDIELQGMELSPAKDTATKNGRATKYQPKRKGYAPLDMVCNEQQLVISDKPSADATNSNPNSSKSSKASSIFLKKIPRTTALRKGVMDPNSTTSKRKSNESRVLVCSKRRRRNETALDLALDDDESEGSYDDGSSEDDEYNPSGENDESDSYCSVDEEASFEDSLALVEDNYCAWDGNPWDNGEEDKDNQFTRLYMNGEMYVDKGWGNIQLKPW